MDGTVRRAGLDSTWVLTLLTLLGVTGIWKNPVTTRALKTHLLGCCRDKAGVGASISVKAEPRGTPQAIPHTDGESRPGCTSGGDFVGLDTHTP